MVTVSSQADGPARRDGQDLQILCHAISLIVMATLAGGQAPAVEGHTRLRDKAVIEQARTGLAMVIPGH